jgi:heat shock protein HslJ
MMKTKLVIVVLLLIGIFSSCKSTFPDTKWANKQWTAVEMSGVPVQTSNSPQDAHLFFNAAEKLVNGNGSCNRIYGPYEIGKKNSLKFGNLASTMMACQNQAFENKYLEVLRSVRYYQLSGGELWLKDGKKRVILKLR